MMVRYEDLVADPAKMLSLVFHFCDCDVTNFPMPRFETNLDDKQIARLSTLEINEVQSIAGDMLRTLGYTDPEAENRFETYQDRPKSLSLVELHRQVF